MTTTLATCPPKNVSATPDGWFDPILETQLKEYQDSVNDLIQGHVGNKTDHAADLCETSRAILYRLPRLNEEQAKKIATVFNAAISAIKALNIEDPNEKKMADAFARHIDRRVKKLLGEQPID